MVNGVFNSLLKAFGDMVAYAVVALVVLENCIIDLTVKDYCK